MDHARTVYPVSGSDADRDAAGSPEVTETTIEVKKNGQVVHTIIEDFSESYYNLDELESTIQQACDTYNASAGKEAVVLKAVKENDDHTVTVVMQYADASAYSAFNKLALFVGTVKDAFNAGYDLNVTLSFPEGRRRADRQGRPPQNGRKAHCSCAGSG